MCDQTWIGPDGQLHVERQVGTTMRVDVVTGQVTQVLGNPQSTVRPVIGAAGERGVEVSSGPFRTAVGTDQPGIFTRLWGGR